MVIVAFRMPVFIVLITRPSGAFDAPSRARVAVSPRGALL